ncbi:MAG: pantetheine-phosphate adenylyltransferase [Chitinispirillaceae bacterium]|jgi:pantetheine-phosphate adenylyltransferase|nr:pantetheine-phosphate adenylyltransferase [Chitinispirillaceae bacterium]
MAIALYPGTFDPITNGHIDIALRATRIFSKVIAVVAENPAKHHLFSGLERLEMLKLAFCKAPKIEVISYPGLIVDCLREHNAKVLIRGLRAMSDFDSEFQMAFTNRNMLTGAETVFLMPSAEYVYLSSTMVKEISKLGGDVSPFVPLCVAKRLAKKYGKK